MLLNRLQQVRRPAVVQKENALPEPPPRGGFVPPAQCSLSLGVIGNGDFTAPPVLASYDPDMVKSATYAVTVEQAGGSPDGNPHLPPAFSGKLIEAVPPPQDSGR